MNALVPYNRSDKAKAERRAVGAHATVGLTERPEAVVGDTEP